MRASFCQALKHMQSGGKAIHYWPDIMDAFHLTSEEFAVALIRSHGEDSLEGNIIRSVTE